MQTASLWGEGVEKCTWGEHLCCSHWQRSCPCSWTARPSLRWSPMNWGLYGCHILGTSYFALRVCFCSAALLTHAYKVPVKSLGSNHEKCVEYRMLNPKDEKLLCGHLSHSPCNFCWYSELIQELLMGCISIVPFLKCLGIYWSLGTQGKITILRWLVTALRCAFRRKKNPFSFFATIAHYLKDLELTCNQFCEVFVSFSDNPTTAEEKFSREIAQLFKWGACRN